MQFRVVGPKGMQEFFLKRKQLFCLGRREKTVIGKNDYKGENNPMRLKFKTGGDLDNVRPRGKLWQTWGSK